MSRPIQLLDLVSRQKLERIIQVFTAATGVASIITYADGHPITSPHNFTPFCLNYCRSTQSGRSRCHESDRHGGTESARSKQPHIYKCLNSGLIDCAVPVIVDGRHLATILAGQVLDEPIRSDLATDRASSIGIRDLEGYLQALSNIPLMPRERLLAIINLMSEITQTISELALQKVLLQRRSQKYLNRLINSISDCIICTDAESTINMVNQAGSSMFGCPADLIIGRSIHDLLADEQSRTAYENNVKSKLITNWKAELTAERADGTAFPVQVSLSAVGDRHERNAGYVGVIRDISEQKQLDRMKEDLISMVTHDMRNPALSLERVLDLLVKGDVGPLTHDQKEIMHLALTTSRQLYRMLSDILDIYRKENGQFVLYRTLVSGREILAESLNQVSVPALEKHITLEQDFSHSSGRVYGDCNRLLRTCVNLLDNAIRYSPERGHIRVSMARVTEEVTECIPNHLPRLPGTEDGYHLFSFEDEGPGIAEEFHQAVFDKYFTTDSKASGRKEGVGLGLAFCKHVVEAHGGVIWVESPLRKDCPDSGRGCRLRFVLPSVAKDFTPQKEAFTPM